MADATGTKRLVTQHGDRVARAATADLTRQLKDAARPGSGFGQSGDTARQIRSRQTAGSPVFRHRIESPTPQSTWREKGTRAHPITPKRAQALRFFWPKVGRVVVFAKVNHPGNNPMPWFNPIVREWGRALQQAARRIG